MKKVFIDTNVVLDFALMREPFTTVAVKVFDKIVEGEISGYITASSTTDIFYILKKARGKEKALMFLRELVKNVYVLDISKEVINDALYSNFEDFEDAVQYHAALTNVMDIIVTRDTNDFEHSNIPVYLPEEL
jgi:predicted nucleic acid-binding protein